MAAQKLSTNQSTQNQYSVILVCLKFSLFDHTHRQLLKRGELKECQPTCNHRDKHDRESMLQFMQLHALSR